MNTSPVFAFHSELLRCWHSKFETLPQEHFPDGDAIVVPLIIRVSCWSEPLWRESYGKIYHALRNRLFKCTAVPPDSITSLVLIADSEGSGKAPYLSIPLLFSLMDAPHVTIQKPWDKSQQNVAMFMFLLLLLLLNRYDRAVHAQCLERWSLCCSCSWDTAVSMWVLSPVLFKHQKRLWKRASQVEESSWWWSLPLAESFLCRSCHYLCTPADLYGGVRLGSLPGLH